MSLRPPVIYLVLLHSLLRDKSGTPAGSSQRRNYQGMLDPARYRKGREQPYKQSTCRRKCDRTCDNAGGQYISTYTLGYPLFGLTCYMERYVSRVFGHND